MTQTTNAGLRNPSSLPESDPWTEYDPNSKHWFTTSFLPAGQKATLGRLSMTQTPNTGLRRPSSLPESDAWRTEYEPNSKHWFTTSFQATAKRPLDSVSVTHTQTSANVVSTDRKVSISGPYQSGSNAAPSAEALVEPLASTASEIGRPVTEGAPGTDNYQQCTISKSPRLARSHGT